MLRSINSVKLCAPFVSNALKSKLRRAIKSSEQKCSVTSGRRSFKIKILWCNFSLGFRLGQASPAVNYNFTRRLYQWHRRVINTGALCEQRCANYPLVIVAHSRGVSRYSPEPLSEKRSCHPLKEALALYRDLHSCITWNEHRFSERAVAVTVISMRPRRAKGLEGKGGPRRDEAGAPNPMSDNEPPRLLLAVNDLTP